MVETEEKNKANQESNEDLELIIDHVMDIDQILCKQYPLIKSGWMIFF